MSKQTELAQVADTITVDSGNVGIGTTADQQASSTNEGIWLAPGATSSFSANSVPLTINRMGTGGNNRINIDLRNNGTSRAELGSLGASNGMYIAIGGTERMRIDASGRVTKPYQPSFRAYRAAVGNVTYGVGNSISASMTSTNYNVGGHYNTSNGRFTAPIAGRYLFWCTLYNNSSLSLRRIRADINGSVGVWGQNQSSPGSDWTTSGIADLSAGDYVDMVSAYSDTIVFHDVNHSVWGGYLIG